MAARGYIFNSNYPLCVCGISLMLASVHLIAVYRAAYQGVSLCLQVHRQLYSQVHRLLLREAQLSLEMEI